LDNLAQVLGAQSIYEKSANFVGEHFIKRLQILVRWCVVKEDRQQKALSNLAQSVVYQIGVLEVVVCKVVKFIQEMTNFDAA
jgi:hypothetical protein